MLHRSARHTIPADAVDINVTGLVCRSVCRDGPRRALSWTICPGGYRRGRRLLTAAFAFTAKMTNCPATTTKSPRFHLTAYLIDPNYASAIYANSAANLRRRILGLRLLTHRTVKSPVPITANNVAYAVDINSNTRGQFACRPQDVYLRHGKVTAGGFHVRCDDRYRMAITSFYFTGIKANFHEGYIWRLFCCSRIPVMVAPPVNVRK